MSFEYQTQPQTQPQTPSCLRSETQTSPARTLAARNEPPPSPTNTNSTNSINTSNTLNANANANANANSIGHVVMSKTSSCRSVLSGSISPVFIGHLRFIVMDCPSSDNLEYYLRELQARGVKRVIRLCEPIYDVALFQDNGITVHDLFFQDGGIPPPAVISTFLSLVTQDFGALYSSLSPYLETQNIQILADPPVHAIHCIAGLGRAPLLAAIALIEAGMEGVDAIEFVRKCRRGAFNRVQVAWICAYKRGKHTRSSASSWWKSRSGKESKKTATLGESALGKILSKVLT